MGAEAVASIIYSKEIAEADDPETFRKKKVEELKAAARPYSMPYGGLVDDIIEPGGFRMFYWHSNQSGEVLGLAVAQARVSLHNAQFLVSCAGEQPQAGKEQAQRFARKVYLQEVLKSPALMPAAPRSAWLEGGPPSPFAK
jgi:hypothetical protein